MTGGSDVHLGLLVSGRFSQLEDALCDRILELKRDDPLAPVTVIVGSAAVRTRVSDQVVRRLRAVANLSVATLGRLAADLVAAREGAPPVVLSGLARERLVRLVVNGPAADLEYFGPVVDRPHFAQALAATLADLREACIRPDSPWSDAVRGASSEPGGNGAQAHDLDSLYRACVAELDARRLLDRAGVQLEAAAAVA